MGASIARNNIGWTYSYNARLALKPTAFGEQTTLGSSNATLYQLGLGYDPNGNILSLNDLMGGVARSRSMGYDGADRLTSVNAPQQWGQASYTYDVLDNLRSKSHSSQTVMLGYGSADNRLNSLSVNGASWALNTDARGNLTQRGTLHLNWDADNRVTSVSGAASQTYEYDGHGRRVWVRNADGSSQLQIYSQAGQLLWARKLNASAAVQQDTLTGYLDGKAVVEVSTGSATATGVNYLHTDGLGSPVLRTDASGVVKASTQYDPWGDTWAGDEPSSLGFTGHVNDAASGLVYMQQRYYDPLLGRFLSVDPVVTDANTGKGFGIYTYVENNPYSKIDPDGREFKFAAGVSPQFKKDIYVMRSYLATAGVDGPLKAIDASNVVINIQPAAVLNDMHFNPNTMTIVIDTRSGLQVAPGQVQTPALGFLHEGAHAAREISDPNGKATDKATPAGEYGNKEEQRVIDKVETPAAKALDEPSRNNHGGTPVQVDCAICTK